jgi:hypothetical protein
MTEPIARIEAALTRLGAEHEPPVGWQARVLAATATRKQRPWWQFAIPAVALAGIAIFVVVRPPAKDQPLEVALEFDKHGAVVRGKAAHVGDLMHAKATGGGHYRAVWVYHGDQLLIACPGATQCRSSGDATIADVELRLIGDYTIVALASNSPVPPPMGTLDIDIANADKAGAKTKPESLTVR